MNRIVVAGLLALAACGGEPAAESETAAKAGEDPAADGTTALPANQVGSTTVDPDTKVSSEPKPPAVIPAQYRGRWGMVEADCSSTRGDAKGLIDIAETKIRFYESTATLRERRPAISTSFAGLFDFAGEGQQWQKVMSLTRTGDTLKRADDEGSYNYRSCDQ